MARFEYDVLQEIGVYILVFVSFALLLRLLFNNSESYKRKYGFNIYVFVCVALIVGIFAYQQTENRTRYDYFYEIKECGIYPVTAKAKKINKYPFGIELTLHGDSVVHHRMELYEGHDEFINRVNRGALVSKVRNSTDIMLINGADTTYYPLVY